jgi:hypothetical protein
MASKLRDGIVAGPAFGWSWRELARGNLGELNVGDSRGGRTAKPLQMNSYRVRLSYAPNQEWGYAQVQNQAPRAELVCL